jgi:hypothetical protein
MSNGPRTVFWLIGDDEFVRFHAQVGARERVAHVRLRNDDAFDDDRHGLIVRGAHGKCRLIKVRLSEIKAARAQHRGEREEGDPTQFGRAR